jgi:hypothetical protein
VSLNQPGTGRRCRQLCGDLGLVAQHAGKVVRAAGVQGMFSGYEWHRGASLVRMTGGPYNTGLFCGGHS